MIELNLLQILIICGLWFSAGLILSNIIWYMEVLSND
jgi:hypothetical protein